MGNDGFFRILTFNGYVSQNSRAATVVKVVHYYSYTRAKITVAELVEA